MDLLKKGIPLLPAVTLEKDRNHMLKAPYFETSACLGINVISTPKNNYRKDNVFDKEKFGRCGD